MSFNIVNIQVVNDYTDFSHTVRFHLNVPVTAKDADTLIQALASDPWDKVQGDLTTAVQNAPQPVQDLVGALIKAYSGKSSSPSKQSDQPDTSKHQDDEPAPDPDT